MDLDAVADELYSLPTGEFIVARNRSVRQARSEGDRQLAEQIRSLRRPSTAAWLTNQLVREHRGEIQPLLDLGRELREVMADLDADELRELTQQRYRLVSALVQRGRTLGAVRGVRVTDEVAQVLRSTLEATLSDPDSARSVASGRLTEALSVSGFGSGAGAGAGAAKAAHESTPRSPGKGTAVSDLDVKRKDKARRLAERVAEAEESARTARGDLETAADRLRSAGRLHAAATAAAEQLREQLAQADLDLERKAEGELEARQDRDDAERLLEAADQQLVAAEAELRKTTT